MGILVNCAPDNPLNYVDPRIGSVGLILEPTRPTVQLPNQMIRVYPNRKDYLDDQITSFPLTLISHRNGQLFRIMPFTGDFKGIEALRSAWDQGTEITTPHYYSVVLLDYNTEIKFTPGKKTGIFRINFPRGAEKHLLLNIVQQGQWHKVTETSFAGEENFEGMKAYTVVEINAPAEYNDLSSGDAENKGAILSWNDTSA